MPSIAQCTGGAQPGAPLGTHHTPRAPPLAQLSPWGALVTVGHPWGQPALTPSPGLLSKPLSDVCSPGSFSGFLSHGLAALGAPAGAGAGEDSSQGHPEPLSVTQRPLSVTQRPPSVTQRPLGGTQRAAHGFTPL